MDTVTVAAAAAAPGRRGGPPPASELSRYFGFELTPSLVTGTSSGE